MNPKSNLVFQMLLFSLLILTFAMTSNAQILNRNHRKLSKSAPQLSSHDSATEIEAIDADESFLTPLKKNEDLSVEYKLVFGGHVYDILRFCPSEALARFEKTTAQPMNELKKPVEALFSSLKKKLEELRSTLKMKPELYHLLTQHVEDWRVNANKRIQSEAAYFTKLILTPFYANPNMESSTDFEGEFLGATVKQDHFQAQIQRWHVSFSLGLRSIKKTFFKNNLFYQEQLDKVLTDFEKEFQMATIELRKCQLIEAILKHCKEVKGTH